MDDNAVDILRSVFKDVQPEVLQKLIDVSQVKDYQRRTYLCRQGEYAEKLYILIKGEVGVVIEISGEYFHLDTIRYGSFGEIALLLDSDSTRTATLITRTPTTVIEINARDFRNLAKDHPEIALGMARLVLKRLVNQDKEKVIELKQSVNLSDVRNSETANMLSVEKYLDRVFSEVPVNEIANRVFRTISTFGEPRQDLQYQCDIFMIMPFKPDLEPVFQNVRELATQLNLSMVRGDDFFSHRTIMSEIWSVTHNAKLLICDCTNKNPNVFYELGIAHAVGKKVILITQNKEDVPFDIQQFRYIRYENSAQGMIDLSKKLKTAIQQFLKT
jgi:CRP-like cAMP-binding protein